MSADSTAPKRRTIMSSLARTRHGLVLVGLLLAFVTPVFAGPDVNTSGGYTLAGAPLALRGYDPVAYFQDGKPVLGSAKYSAVHAGAAYQFASEENLKLFKKTPERYAPQYGGFCAYGASLGKKFDGDPLAWKVVDGKLYLNLSPDIQAKWQEDVAGNVAKADKAWPSIKDKAPSAIN
jgi:YHS domain-containing protein